MKGFRIFHDSEYFREKKYFHPDNAVAEKWIRAILEHASYYDVKSKYSQGKVLGQGKFSTVYMATALEMSSGDDVPLAMKILDKKQLTPKEREFLRDEIQIIHTIVHPHVVNMKENFEDCDKMYIMMEIVQGGELFEHIKDYEISEREACLITH